MVIETHLSYILVSAIWISMLFISALIWYHFPNGIYYWDKLCQNCTTKSAKYRYVIRFIFSDNKTSFQISKSTVWINILNSKMESLVVLTVVSKQLEQSVVYKRKTNLKVCHFLLYRKVPLEDITMVGINHNGNKSMRVGTIEIQDIKSGTANVAYVGTTVRAVDRTTVRRTQKFPAANVEARRVEAELKPTISLTALEFMAFLFLAINMIILLTLYLIPCREAGLCTDYRGGLLSTIFSALAVSCLAASVFAILVIGFRYYIKRYLYITQGKCIHSIARCLVILLTISAGAFIGIISMVVGADHFTFPETNPGRELFHEIFWMFAIGLGMAIFLLLILPIMSIIGHLIGFFSQPEDIIIENAANSVATELPNEKESSVRSPTDEDTAEDTDEITSDYYSKLMKGNQRVKSISQYKGVITNQSKPSTNPDKDPAEQPTKSAISREKLKTVPKRQDSNIASSNRSNTASVRQTKSTESIGTGYYKQLMKGKAKVKSVSQY